MIDQHDWPRGHFAIATQKQYNDQKAQIEAAHKAGQAIRDAIAQSLKATPSVYANNVTVTGFQDRDYYWSTFSGSGASIGHPDWHNDADNISFSFDADVSNLKAGDVIDIFQIDLTNQTNGQATNVFAPIGGDGIPLLINGVQYGKILSRVQKLDGTWGNFIDRSSKIDYYAVITKDVPGVGNQHFDIKKTGGITVNYMATPSWFAGHDVINLVLTAHPGNSNQVLGQEHQNLHKKTQQPGNMYTTGDELHPDQDNNQSFWSRQIDGVSVVPSQNSGEFVDSGYSKGVNIQDQYWLNQKVTNSTGFANNESTKIYSDGSVQAEVQPFNSAGKMILADPDVNSTADKYMMWPNHPQNVYLADGLSFAQMRQQGEQWLKTHPAYTEGSVSFFSKQDDKTYLVESTVSKQVLQKALIGRIGNAQRYGDDSWQIQADADPAKALQNTLNFLHSPALQGLSTIYSWGTIRFAYGDPTVQNDQTVTRYDDNGKVIRTSQNHSTPYQVMHEGQSGVKVHYLDGSTGQEMKNYTWSIGDAGKPLEVDPDVTLGWHLTTEGAKGIPAGAQTIEFKTTISYPAQGQWKDVYVVYMPYLTSGTATASYHYDVTLVKAVIPYRARDCHPALRKNMTRWRKSASLESDFNQQLLVSLGLPYPCVQLWTGYIVFELQ